MSNPYSALVYAARSSDVRTTLVDGRVLVDEGRLTGLDPEEAVARGREQVRQLTLRARLG
jgi:5-methylthioadenosine/S-adenosylhomocysteine deaminase